MKPALAATDSALLELLEQARKYWPELTCEGGTDLWERALYGPLREFLRRPGKAFRARLVEAAWEAAGGLGAPPKSLPRKPQVRRIRKDGATERRDLRRFAALQGLESDASRANPRAACG